MKFLVFILCIVLGNTSLTAAQGGCDLRKDLAETLEKTYGESLIALGLLSTGGILELFVDYKDRSWTIIITQTNGISCIGASGIDFQFRVTTDEGDES